ncbi:Uncharacterised protein [Mycobacterium tuberculosis]|nr:Uncharacterised protein [Mycobacterium tuberculosis]
MSALSASSAGDASMSSSFFCVSEIPALVTAMPFFR